MVEAKPPPYPEYREHQTEPTSEYRVVLWEQPEMEDTDPESIGWGELTIDLIGVQDVHKAIETQRRSLRTTSLVGNRRGRRSGDTRERWPKPAAYWSVAPGLSRTHVATHQRLSARS
jgi:hypothetical protein